MTTILYFYLLNENREILLDIIDHQLVRASSLSTKDFNNYIRDYLAMSRKHPIFFGTEKNIEYQKTWAKETYDLFELKSIVDDFRILNQKYNIQMKG